MPSLDPVWVAMGGLVLLFCAIVHLRRVLASERKRYDEAVDLLERFAALYPGARDAVASLTSKHRHEELRDH